MRIRTCSIALLGSAILVCVSLSACGQPALEFIPNGGTYTMSEAEAMASGVSLSDVGDVKTSEGSALRSERLLQLREKGAEAALLADALVRDFPSGAASVPLLVESATVDGTSVWLVVEAWGDEDGVLSRRRLWVLDRLTYGVVASSSFN
jgi:hypothetical protein